MTFTNKKNIDSGNKIDITVIYLKLIFPINVPKDKIKRTLEITNPKYWNLSISELREPIFKILGILKSPEFSLSIYIDEVWIAQNSKNPLLSLE